MICGEGFIFWFEDDDECVGDVNGDIGVWVMGLMVGRRCVDFGLVGDGVLEFLGICLLVCIECVIFILGMVGVVVLLLLRDELLLYFICDGGWFFGGKLGWNFWFLLVFLICFFLIIGGFGERGE